MGKIPKATQDRIHEIAAKRAAEDSQLQAELNISEEQYNVLLGRATLRAIKGYKSWSGYHLFVSKWYQENNGIVPSEGSKKVGEAWRALSHEEQERYSDMSKKKRVKLNSLNPSEKSRSAKRNKYCDMIMNTMDVMSVECNLESIMFTASSLKGEQYAGTFGTSNGLQAAQHMKLDEKFADFQIQLHHDLMHSMYTNFNSNSNSEFSTNCLYSHFLVFIEEVHDIDNSNPKGLDESRTFISQTLNQLFKQAGGTGKLQFKNWDRVKSKWGLELVGWPATVSLTSVGKLLRDERTLVIDALKKGDIQFVRT